MSEGFPPLWTTCARCSAPCPFETTYRVTPSLHLCPDCRARNDLVGLGLVPALIEQAQQTSAGAEVTTETCA